MPCLFACHPAPGTEGLHEFPVTGWLVCSSFQSPKGLPCMASAQACNRHDNSTGQPIRHVPPPLTLGQRGPCPPLLQTDLPVCWVNLTLASHLGSVYSWCLSISAFLSLMLLSSRCHPGKLCLAANKPHPWARVLLGATPIRPQEPQRGPSHLAFSGCPAQLEPLHLSCIWKQRKANHI